MEAENLRLRVVFEDGGILTKSQKKEGLKHSWVLLKPYFHTISDVVSYLLDCFDLHDSCPNGIILSMDNFVLPPFESTAILKDKDLICVSVKKRGAKLHDLLKAIVKVKTLSQDEIIRKQGLPAIKESVDFQRETDDGENVARKKMLPALEYIPCGVDIAKKRKASIKVEGMKSKTKKRKHMTPESGQKKHVHHSEIFITPVQKKRKHTNESNEDAACHPEICVKGTEVLEPISDSEGSVAPEEIREEITPVSTVPDGTKKVSRSSRRKKLKRQWERKQREKANTEQLQAEEEHHAEDPKTDSGSKMDMKANIIEHQQADENCDAEDNLVPVVIRPGHIRFTPSAKVKDVQCNQEGNGVLEDHSAKKIVWGSRNNQAAKETFQWNGITSKRKGQKWGMEKQSTSSWKGSRDYDASSLPHHYETSSHEGIVQEQVHCNGIASKRNGQKWGDEEQPTSSWIGSRDDNANSSVKSLQGDGVLDFEKLVPLTDLPKASDLIAYRLVELSSSWCPELSSFRVGKIVSFQPESNRIMLVPDPEYPLNPTMKTDDDDNYDDDSEQPPGLSVYNEDGSLEIDFASLVDVRVVKRGDLSQSELKETPQTNINQVPSGTNECVNEAQDGCKNAALSSSNGEKASASVTVKKNAWEEITDALSAKKAQLMQEDGLREKEGPSKGSWSRRGSALGPIMERLRSQNAI